MLKFLPSHWIDVTSVITVHPQGNTNVRAAFYTNPMSSCHENSSKLQNRNLTVAQEEKSGGERSVELHRQGNLLVSVTAI